ncbi:tyrosine-type recombinase/integrase [Phytohabitans sp. ZYX-F-186]|uniref:Tyrosine-type recombinase/integrase n=1 Tax=Phytohabitans maris TaxID=3071409 RepID=A0ABU0ZW94_9ACTN|nr:tyrosine-type recombinase/integrase [Phytohabitans sp. ZYX-F-186]MDQ7910772.1 tyrosine-type recombinase/integrase [Phytohabitans sp. ZYX-F-186]
MNVSTFKRCRCRADGKELGAKCPKLRRADGSYNPRHGYWSWMVDIPVERGQKRNRPKRGNRKTQDEAAKEGTAVAALLAIPEAGRLGEKERGEIMALVDRALKAGAPLPSADVIRRRVKTGLSVSTDVLVGDFLTTWLAGKKDIRSTTRRGYETHIRVYLVPHLGRIPIEKLRAAHISAMFDEIDAENERIRQVRKDGTAEQRAALRYRKIAGPATKQRIRACLRSALNDARAEGLVEVNVAGGKLIKMESAKKPKALVWTKERVARWQEIRTQIAALETDRTGALDRCDWTEARRLAAEIEALREKERPSKVMVWTPAQTGRFLDFVSGHRLYAMFHLITFRGLRRGESCGLRWIDLDLDEGIATIAEQLVTVGWEVEEGEPKSEAGNRDVALDAGTVQVIRAHRRQQLEDRLRWGSAWIDSGRVFTREDGSELHPASVTDMFNSLVEEAGLPPIRLHDLRHGAATLAKAAGIDTKVISEMLGHSSRKITDDTYTSVFVEVAKEAAEAVVGIVPRAVVGRLPDPAGLRLVPDGPEMMKGAPSDGENALLNRGAPEGTRTPNLLIRRSGRSVRRRSPSYGYPCQRTSA